MNGEREGDALRRAVGRVLDETPLIEAVDYVSVAGTEGLAELDRVTGPAMVAVAVRMGRARLIDNLVLDPGRLSASP
jgi:pantoate--beta-alanine ligase